MSPDELTPATGLDYMRSEYEKYYVKYQKEAKDHCYQVNKDSDKK